MPANGETPISSDWTLITPDNVTALTFQNVNNFPIRIWGTVGAVAPSGVAGLLYDGGQGERNVAMADLFPGLAGANRVYARIPQGLISGLVFRSYA